MKSDFLKYSLGIDVSKDENQVCLSVINQSQRVSIKATRKFSNSAKGFDQLLEWLKKHLKHQIPLSIVLEATGVYHEQIAWFLYEKGLSVSIVLPNKAKNYLKAIGLKSKNDTIDASGLARMGAEQNLPAWKPSSKHFLKLKRITRHQERLQNIKTNLSNQLHAVESSYASDKVVIKSLKQLIKNLDSQIKKAEKELDRLLDQDQELKRKVDGISASLKGLGRKTLVTIVAETDGFATIYNQRQLTSFAGYDVVENQSGKSLGKTKISKKGNSHIRRALFMSSFNMVRYEITPFTALYSRIYKKSGLKMKAYTAIQRKLLILIYALWKKDEVYSENYYKTSGNDEPKLLFSFGSEGDRKIAPDKSRATQDGLPCKESPEALFSLKQS